LILFIKSKRVLIKRILDVIILLTGLSGSKQKRDCYF